MAEPTERDRELAWEWWTKVLDEPCMPEELQDRDSLVRLLAAARKEGRQEAIEECSADAARYRWLRDSGRASYEDVYGNHKFVRDDNIDLEISSGKST